MRKILIASTALMLFTGIGAAFADISMKEFQLPSGSRPMTWRRHPMAGFGIRRKGRAPWGGSIP